MSDAEAIAEIAAILDNLEPAARVRVGRWAASYATDTGGKPPSDKGRGLSPSWKAVLAGMKEGEPYDYDDIARIAVEAGHSLKRSAIRAQAHNYSKNGWLVALDGGQFEITNAGREMAIT